ncbi:hypothetical protein [uncultured Pseudokineococcus sp.]|uniref:hypothetical protein n=1 Tax=uncultured Pseudokineococcus sp. TaxID=1642928 RepID=UPI0026122F19|nr:hypothetical protein [uncultured Pseudokineococcus sp.]
MTPTARTATVGPVARALQCTAAATAVALSSALVLGVQAGRADEAPATASAALVQASSSHHGAPPAAVTGDGPQTASPADGPPAPGAEAHDHGDLEVTVMLGADGTTEVLGPVRSGAFISFVNHTPTDQVLSTSDGALVVEVPLRRLVTVQVPDAADTYELVSSTDPTVSADLVVTSSDALPR